MGARGNVSRLLFGMTRQTSIERSGDGLWEYPGLLEQMEEMMDIELSLKENDL